MWFSSRGLPRADGLHLGSRANEISEYPQPWVCQSTSQPTREPANVNKPSPILVGIARGPNTQLVSERIACNSMMLVEAQGLSTSCHPRG